MDASSWGGVVGQGYLFGATDAKYEVLGSGCDLMELAFNGASHAAKEAIASAARHGTGLSGGTHV